MIPTSQLPIAPATFAANVEFWFAVVAVGTFVALVVGFLAHRREVRRQARIVLGERPAASGERSRVSA